MRVTFLRHGQSEHNAGLTRFLDSGLTPLGVQQSVAAAQRFRSEGFSGENTVAFVSPLLRTLQTLEPSALSLLLPTEVFCEVREYFSVRNEGYKTFEGLANAKIRELFPWANVDSNINFESDWWPKEQEDDIQLYARASTVRDQLIAKYFDTGKQLLIVSHADPIGRMIESFLRVPPNLDGPPWSGNCGVTRLEISSATNPAKVLVMNDLSHLTAESLLSPR